MKMMLNGAQIITEVLIEQGVDTLFGYPGGAALNIYEALYQKRDRLKHYMGAHEQGATHAADGYARATGKTGVMIATSGPGATNTVTGIATAYMDSVPMVVITANVSTDYIGRDSFQEIYITGITQAVTKHNYLVLEVEKLADTLRSAFYLAQNGRKGPVLVDIPKDVTAMTCEFTCRAPLEQPPFELPPESQLQELALLLNSSQRPVLCFGGGAIASGASEELKALISECDIPACHTIMGTGIAGFGDRHELGMLGMHGSYAANRAIEASDMLLCVGMRFSDRVALDKSRFAPHAKIVQIDLDAAEIGKNVDVFSSIVGDCKTVLRALLPFAKQTRHDEWLDQIELWRKEDHVPMDEPGKLKPCQIMDIIGELAGEKLIIVTDVGQHQMWAAQYCKRLEPRGFITSGGLGTMGFGYGAAIGAKLGRPDRTVVHITSDGSLHMNMNEACTAASYGVKVITVIMNNKVLGMVRQWQKLFYEKHYMSTQPERKTDYVKVAEGFGLKGFTSQDVESFKAAFSSALAEPGAVWIDCAIDREEDVFPMIPNGQTVYETIMK